MPHRRRLAAAALVALAAAAAGLAPAARARAQQAPPAAGTPDAAAARAPVERLYAALEGVMQRADELGFDGRRAALEPVVAASYDVAFMAQLILGAEWRRLAPEQQARWIETFTRFTVATYADRFDRATVRFEIGGVDPAGSGTTFVRTVLHREDKEPVELDYRVRPTADGWRIVDVFLSGTVSELALRRSEYAAILRRDGFDALLAAIEQKIAAAKAGTAQEAGAP